MDGVVSVVVGFDLGDVSGFVGGFDVFFVVYAVVVFDGCFVGSFDFGFAVVDVVGGFGDAVLGLGFSVALGGVVAGVFPGEELVVGSVFFSCDAIE